jgi:hypothetical protein
MPAVACRTEAVASADDLLKAPFEALPSQVKRALVVGATRYQDPLAPLEFTDQDAQEFARLLKELWHFPEENVIRMTDGEAIPNLQPTGNNLFTQIQRMKETVKPESVLVFFFSGHGVRAEDKDWLIPVDGNLANPARTCSSATELRDTLETVRPHRALLIIDACRNRLETDKGVGVSGGAGQDTRQPKHPQLAVMYA